MKRNKTYSVKPSEIKRQWFLIDAKGKALGRLSTKAAALLRGKHKPIFSPHIDTGDFVIIINADQFTLSGKKTDEKYYFRHSGYHGGDKYEEFKRLMIKAPTKAVLHSVRGMLPRNRLGDQMVKKLRLYLTDKHPYSACNPQKVEV